MIKDITKKTFWDFRAEQAEIIVGIDELSKKTLGSYVKKAIDNVASKDKVSGYSLGQSKNNNDIVAATKLGNKAVRRRRHISKAVDHLSK